MQIETANCRMGIYRTSIYRCHRLFFTLSDRGHFACFIRTNNEKTRWRVQLCH